MKQILKCTLLTLICAPLISHAVPITRTYDFSASFGGAIAPDPATGTITVTFDPDGGDVFGATSATLDSSNFVNDSSLVFNFFTVTDSIQVGGSLNGLGGVLDNTNDFLLSLDQAASATPFFSLPMFLTQSGFSQAQSISSTVSVAVPEPGTLGLLGAGLLGLWFRRKAA